MQGAFYVPFVGLVLIRYQAIQPASSEPFAYKDILPTSDSVQFSHSRNFCSKHSVVHAPNAAEKQALELRTEWSLY